MVAVVLDTNCACGNHCTDRCTFEKWLRCQQTVAATEYNDALDEASGLIDYIYDQLRDDELMEMANG